MKQLTGTGSGIAHILTSYQETLPSVLRSRATWLFLALYIVAAITYMLMGGSAFFLLKLLGFIVVYLAILLFITPLTANAPTPAWEEVATYSRQLLWWQFAALLIFCLLEILYDFLLFGPLQTMARFGVILFQLGNIFMILLLLVVLPLLIMRLLKVRWSEMGFGHGYRVWVAIGISCLVPIIVLLIQVITGRGILSIFGGSVRYLLLAGFPEEVFFRGLLLTRLVRLTGTKWGIVLSALIFGLIHMAVNMSSGSSIVEALVVAMLTQALLGVVLAILFVRTRNVWASEVFHTLIDATGL